MSSLFSYDMQDISAQSIVEALPIGAAIFTGPDHTIKAANADMLAIWAKDASAIGKDLHVAIPEIQDQPFFDLLTGIYSSGQPFHDPNGKAELLVDGKIQTVYFDYWLRPVKDAEGKTLAIINTATNVTVEVLAQENISKAYEEIQAINEELQATNEELGATISALQTTNEQLSSAREAAQIGLFDWDLVNKSYSWDARFKQMFGLPEAYDPDHFHVMVERLHADDRSRVRQAVAASQDRELSGGRYDIEYRIVGAGDVPVRWARALGRVIFDGDGTPLRFIGTLMDITEQVLTREQLLASEERLRLAIESADLGTWSLNVETGEFMTSARTRQLFGYAENEEMPFPAAVAQIEERYRGRVSEAINLAMATGDPYDIEYPILGFHDQKVRWVRATGKVYAAAQDQLPHFSGTLDDITEDKQNDQRKNDFISMVSHELKTPLTSLNGYVQMLQRYAPKGDTQLTSGLIDKSKKQIGKMTTLINGFLDAARFEAGRIHIERKRFDMALLVKEVEESIVPEATSHKVIFAPVEETWVNVDQDKIEQVINNFINNAVKYSPPYTTIQIACVTRDDHAYVSVRDEGLGIKPEDQPRLFERFYRVEGQQTKSISGFGIGLYICKEIIEHHNGEIGVISAPGIGSTFWFTLPIDSGAE